MEVRFSHHDRMYLAIEYEGYTTIKHAGGRTITSERVRQEILERFRMGRQIPKGIDSNLPVRFE